MMDRGTDQDHEQLKLPLLVHEEDAAAAAEEENSFGDWSVGAIRAEARKIIAIAWPIILMNLLQYAVQLLSLMMVGHLGELSLSAASLASSFANVTGFYILMGMACALETLCGQAFGANQYRLLGVLLQRATFTLLCTSIPLSLVWIFMDKILTALGQDPLIAKEAGRFAIWMIPGLFAYAFLQPLMKFLQAQSLVTAMMLCSAITLLFHVPLCWFLVFKSGLGNRGAALANAISYWVNVVLLLLYIAFSPACKKTWAPISKDALQGIKNFLTLALPSTAMICLEFWAFEMLILLSGLLPNPEVETSVLSISFSTISLAYMIPFGLGAAASTRVANELGAGRAHCAKLAVPTAMCLACLHALIVGSTFVGIRKKWGHAFSNDKEIINYVAIMMPILAVSTSMDGFQGVVAGIARGCGWQNIAACANFVAYYIVGVPAAALFAFLLHLGGKGLWLGILCGLGTQIILLGIITACTDWSKQERNARDRVNASALPIIKSDMSKGLH